MWGGPVPIMVLFGAPKLFGGWGIFFVGTQKGAIILQSTAFRMRFPGFGAQSPDATSSGCWILGPVFKVEGLEA